MSKKIDFDAAANSAANVVKRFGGQDRFAKAREVLSQVPTGQDALDGGESFTRETKESANVAQSYGLKLDSRLGQPAYCQVPLEEIDENPYNARQIYNPEKVAALAQSMAANGQLIPGLALKSGDRYVLIAGHYRKRAAKQAGLPGLKLMVYEALSDQDLYLLSYKENNEHNEQTVIDNAIAWAKVLQDKVYESEVELAEAVGQSKANVNKILAVNKLSSIVMDVASQAPELFKLSVLYEIYLLQQAGGADIAAQTAARVIDGDVGRKEVAAIREKIEQAGGVLTKRKNETSRRYSLPNGQIRDWDSGRVMVDIKVEDEAKKQEFLEYVRQHFGQ